MEGTSNACQTAYNARRALELAHLDPTYRLMSCAVGADSAKVRQCCVTQLGGEKTFAKLLDQPDRVPVREAAYDYRALVGAAFPSVPLASELLERRRQRWRNLSLPAPDNVQPTSDKDGGGKRFGTLQSAVQDWVVQLGCRVHYSAPSRRLVPAAFVPLVESDGCAPTDVAPTGMYSAHSWSQMCLGMYDYRRKLAYTPREALCGALTDATVGQTITYTDLIVAGAISDARQVRGVAQKKLELVGQNFGQRLFGFTHGPARDKSEEPDSEWLGDAKASPMAGW